MDALKEKIDMSKKRMMEKMQDNLSEMIESNRALATKMEDMAKYRADQMYELVSSLRQNNKYETPPTSPPRKQPRNLDDATPMEDVTTTPTNTPASPQNLFQNGKDARAGEKH